MTTQKRLSGKVALVTGASRGIGRSIAEHLGREGATVVVNYHSNRSKADEVVAQIQQYGSEALALQGDLTKLADIGRLFAAVKEQFGKLDIFVSNAFTTSVFAPTAYMKEADYDSMFAATKGHYFALQQAAHHVTDGGRIIVLSTGATQMPGAASGAYAGSKAAIERFAFALSRELGPRQVTVNVVSPGLTETDGLVAPKEMIDQLVAQTPMGRLGKPDDVAGAVLLLALDEARWVTGQNVNANGGIL